MMRRLFTTLTLLLMLMGVGVRVGFPQTRRKTSRTKPTTAPVVNSSAQKGNTKKESDARVSKEAENSRNELIEATKRYRNSLQDLIVYQERDAARVTERRDKIKELYVQGLIAKRELDDSEKALAAARGKVEATRGSMNEAETVIAQTLEESKLAEQLARAPQVPAGGFVKTVAYIRYNGPFRWSLATDAARVQSFYLAKFGRVLPTSAFGQTGVHNQLGFDHHNAMDVAVHPDSAEGQALMTYLRGAGIPFIAFRQAIAGSATGPHIHIGPPSHRTGRS